MKNKPTLSLAERAAVLAAMLGYLFLIGALVAVGLAVLKWAVQTLLS